MADHKNIDRICVIIGIVTLIIGVVFAYCGESLGITAGTSADLSYVTTLFDDTVVHSIDIEISEADWNNLQENAAAEEYQLCAVTVDGEKLDNVAIRPKGNSSLSSVVSSDSERYSFKIDFDKYSDGLTYHGLDKLNLNNIISDNSYLKEYLSYDMMAYMGVAAPLSSFVKVSVNGEYFGLYLAVEGVEEAFAERNYSSDYGNIYKPDSMQIGSDGERGGGEKPDMSQMPEMSQDIDDGQISTDQSDPAQATAGNQRPDIGSRPDGGQMSGAGQPPAANQSDDGSSTSAAATPDLSSMPDISQMGDMFGASGDDVALIYSDDQLSSYENIWEGAVFDVTTSDKERLIDSIKQLNAGENLEQVVDVEAVLKYFVVHNFVNNYDSYTGSMKHNYYLREEAGQLSMIAWDYNLAFSNFMGGVGGENTTTTATNTDEATTLVNYPIDTPVSGTTMEERPLINEMLTNETYLAQYHQYFEEFIAGYFESGQCAETIDKAVALISAAVKEDPTAFCSYDEYVEGVAVLKQFCELRAESVTGQLAGTIPTTTTGQTEQLGMLINASNLKVAALGSSMGGGMNKTMTAPTDLGTDRTANSDSMARAQTTAPTQQSAQGQMPNRPGGETTTAAATTQPADSSEATTTAENQTGDGQSVPTSENGWQNDRANPNGATATNWDLSTLMLLGGSALLLVMAILVTKFYKR